jgi:metal-responsive CopG/Arc/MetJ family transcriptional regulator
MSGKYEYPFGVKLSKILKDELIAIAKSQGVKPSELVRDWIREKVAESKKRPGRPRVKTD